MTQGGPGDSLLVFQVRAYLEFFQYTNVGRSAAILMVLWAITYALSMIFVKQWTKLRGAFPWNGRDLRLARAARASRCCWSWCSSCSRSSGSC